MVFSKALNSRGNKKAICKKGGFGECALILVLVPWFLFFLYPRFGFLNHPFANPDEKGGWIGGRGNCSFCNAPILHISCQILETWDWKQGSLRKGLFLLVQWKRGLFTGGISRISRISRISNLKSLEYWGLGFCTDLAQIFFVIFSGFRFPENGMFKPFFCADFWCADFCADSCTHFCVDFWVRRFLCRFFAAQILCRFSRGFSADFRRFGSLKIGVPGSRQNVGTKQAKISRRQKLTNPHSGKISELTRANVGFVSGSASCLSRDVCQNHRPTDHLLSFGFPVY